jgi:small subunit ribosomal protein S16
MSLRIRLARGGAKKRPFYRIVVADSRSPRDGRFIEKIGTYNPMVAKDHPERIKLDEDRAKHWISVGATPSDRVARFLGQANVIAMPAIPQQTKKSQPRAKTLERMKEAEKAKAAAAEAAAAAPPQQEEPPAAEPEAEAPAEEAPAEKAAAEEAAADEAPAAAPEAEAPAEEAPAEEAKAEEAPAQEAAPEAPAAEEAAGEEVPSDDAPAAEPEAEAPAEEEAKKD